ncbi:WASH complex subunit 4 isoform X2 [Dendroctonus ponderosae]|uniref:WASH complex subunit 4 n=1 Tax=Dendroctonus ponderosae TaxID=77166 RepID=A0AAR5PVE7_DENPD|nr:WASH complex subunit 4 isoform X2 [Dendroctonus ponderosae]
MITTNHNLCDVCMGQVIIYDLNNHTKHVNMWGPLDLADRKLSADGYKFIGEEKLHQFGSLIEAYTHLTSRSSGTFPKSPTSLEPIAIDDQVSESVSILYLAHSDNGTLSRIVSTLGAICQELQLLKQEAQGLYSSFLFYAEENGNVYNIFESICQLIDPLQRTHSLIKRARYVIGLTLRQLSSILLKGYYVSNSIPSFSEIICWIGDVLIIFIKFDNIFSELTLKNHWLSYKTAVRNIVHKNSSSGFDGCNLRVFSNTLTVLENSLFSGAIFTDFLQECLESSLIIEFKKSSLNEEFYNFLCCRISELEKDEDILLYSDAGLQVNVLVAFYFNAFGITDKKFLKRLLDLNRKVSAYMLMGNIMWYPELFLLRYVPPIVKLIDQRVVESCRLSLVTLRVQNLTKETNKLCFQANHFLIELESKIKLNATALNTRHLKEISSLLFNGLKLTQKMQWIIKWIMNIHLNENMPVTKTLLNCISRLVEMLKYIYSSFKRNMLSINYYVLLISQHLQHVALATLNVVKKNQTQSKSYKDQQLDILSSLKVCEHALKGPNTKWRMVVASLALSASGLGSVQEIRFLIKQLEAVSQYSYLLKKYCDCSVLFWHFNYVMPVYFSKLVASKSSLSKCYPLLSAIVDFEMFGSRDNSGEAFYIFREKLCRPVNQIIESNLRLQTHLHLDLPPSEPFRNYFSLNFNKLFPMHLNGTYKSIKHDTEHYLSTIFYNLTTVVLHDWRTYGDMRRLAVLQYGLQTVDDDLPMQTLDQGLDVLEIMRNINVFVQKYLYNLNTQIFIEECSNNKYLNSINISHVANSIRSHGIGIMNTTVNYTYQFLQDKLRKCSQFLFDEQIKSRLIKDLRHFADHKKELQQMYPYERAEKFNKGIRKLGLPDGVQTYLDLFRKLITHIGNAMGYVRLIRSGGNRCLSQGTCFIPDLTEVELLNDLTENKVFPNASSSSVQFVLKDLNGFTKHFENTTEYFKLLVSTFLSHFRNPSNNHLKTFYIIVPPLTINFVEHSLTCKEKLFKKDKTDSAFTDDGFALGLAYIIELLNQESQFNSLHWFESVQRKFHTDKQKIREQTRFSNSEDTKFKQTLTLTEKKIETFYREFKLLEFSYSSARLFFQS